MISFFVKVQTYGLLSKVKYGNAETLTFLRQYQDIEKTLSNQEIVNDVSRVCANGWFIITLRTNKVVDLLASQ